MKEKKKRINGKSKGSSFEREVSKKLSLYLTNEKEEIGCWRSSSSGATSTINFKNKKKSTLGLQTQSGDIIQTIPQGHYNLLDTFFQTYMVEVKFLKSLDLSPNYSTQFQKIMNQLLREKEQSSKHIFFVLKRNGREVLILTDSVLHCKSVGSLVYNELQFDIYYLKDFLMEKENLNISEQF